MNLDQREMARQIREVLEEKGIPFVFAPSELVHKLGLHKRETYADWPIWKIERKGNRIYKTSNLVLLANYLASIGK